MYFCEINPYIRFASMVKHQSKDVYVQVKDCRLLYAISGSADIYINNQHFTMLENSLFYCSSGQVYKIDSNNISLIAINFDLNQLNNKNEEYFSPIPLSKCKNAYFPDVFIEDCHYLNSSLFIQDGSIYYTLIKEILTEFSHRRILFREKSSTILKNILCQIYRQSILPEGHIAQVINSVISYIYANYNKEISNRFIAEFTGYHEYYLNRIFKKQTGVGIHKYILNIRINEAKKLLLSSDCSMSQIAETVGFKTPNHFSSAFKQIVGVAPYTYKEKFKL